VLGELRDYQQFEDRVLKSAAFQDEANNVPDWMKNWVRVRPCAMNFSEGVCEDEEKEGGGGQDPHLCSWLIALATSNQSNEQFDESMRGELLPRGEDEHFLLAKRLRERYPGQPQPYPQTYHCAVIPTRV
jgi:hypothetical protein